MLEKKLWGILFITLGLIIGLNALGIASINIFFEGWWTFLIIIPSLIGLVSKKQDKTDCIIGLVIGTSFFLSSRDIISFEMILSLILPVILIIVGFEFLLSDNMKKEIKDKFKRQDNENLEDIFAIFGDQNINFKNNSFKGCNLDSIFGSLKLDLRGAKLESDTLIKACSIFGSIDIILDEDVNVVLKTTPIFGSIVNKVRNNNETKKTIYIEGFTLFGGINIR